MSSSHLTFDDAGHHIQHHIQHHIGPRDHPFDITLSLGRQSPMPYEAMDTYIPGSYSRRSSFSHAPPPFEFSDYIHDDPGNFSNSWTQPYPMFDGQGAIQPHLPPLHVQEPAPIHPVSPQLLYPPSHSFNEPEPPHSQFLDHNAGSNSNILYFPSAPSMFAPSSGPWPQAPQEEAVPQPQPSWTMSGSLDPATGIFQRAPEHPRVRTAQACEKCRVRKAKCSGEHPACQRCRTRGLTCEYAPERKMRGPNKVKRKTGGAANNAASRRASVVSSAGSSSDDASVAMSAKPSLTLVSKKPSMDGSTSASIPSPTNSISGSSEASQDSAASKRLHKLRPPTLDIKRTSIGELQTQFLHHASAHAQEPENYPNSEAIANRRASLPTYLMESYSRIAQGRLPPSGLQAERIQRPHSAQPQPSHADVNPHASIFSSHDRIRSTESQSMSMPITPITLTSSNSFRSNFNPSAFASRPSTEFGVASNGTVDNGTWASSIIDLDPTPTAGSSGMEKNLAQMESQMLVSEA